jgi:hypothetical protein
MPSMGYDTLPDGRSIRQLTLLPCNHQGTDIFCRLDIVSLDSIRDYEALSYVWGKPVFDCIIRCNGHPVKVTKSLHGALQGLRSSEKERVLWIDQLCINQQDLLERAQQVCLMGDIYSKAASVVVWLGEADAETGIVWKLLFSLQHIMGFKTPQVYHLAVGGAAESFDDAPQHPQTGASRTLPCLPPEVLALPKGASKEWEAMDRFFARPWFFRMWTFQEVVLAKRCEIHCGAFHMSWDVFSRGMTALRIAGYDSFVGGARFLAEDADTQKRHHASGKHATLAYLLSTCRSRQTTNPCDRIYGVLGVMDPQDTAAIRVDYSRSIAETFAEGVKACIIRQNSLEILSNVEVRRTDDHGLPSWVPDWRYKGSTRVSLGMRSLDGYRYFKAAGATKAEILPTTKWRKLGLKGILVTQIDRFLDVRTALRLDDPCIAHGTLSSSRWSPRFWSKMYRSAVQVLKIPQSCVKNPESLDHFIAFLWESVIRDPPTAEDQLETAFRHTLMADLFPRVGGHCVNDGHFPAYQSWEYHYFRRDVPPQVLLEHDRYVVDAMFNREFFIAGEEPNCYMGIALGTVREGDSIVVLAGGDTPLVLRPHVQRDNQVVPTVDEWEFVAESYVHGLMDGEAVVRAIDGNTGYQDFFIV